MTKQQWRLRYEYEPEENAYIAQINKKEHEWDCSKCDNDVYKNYKAFTKISTVELKKIRERRG